MNTGRRIAVDILTAVFLVLFLLSLLYYRTGSLEMMPTEEDQEKIRGITMIGMVLFGGLCAVFRAHSASPSNKGRQAGGRTTRREPGPLTW